MAEEWSQMKSIPSVSEYRAAFRNIERQVNEHKRSTAIRELLTALHLALPQESTCEQLAQRLGDFEKRDTASSSVMGLFKSLGTMLFKEPGIDRRPLVNPIDSNPQSFWSSIASCREYATHRFAFRLMPQVSEALILEGWVQPALTEELAQIAASLDNAGYFNPATLQDERERRLREIVQRRGQPEFRAKLIKAYNGRCAVTGCDAVEALEAAHIRQYCGPDSNHISNGLLLRADIHTLFDLDLIGFDPESLEIVLNQSLHGTMYMDLQGERLRPPSATDANPNIEALTARWRKFEKK